MSNKQKAKDVFLIHEFKEGGVSKKNDIFVRPYFRNGGACLYRSVYMSSETGRDRRSPANNYQLNTNVSNLDITNAFQGALALIKAGKI